MVNYHKQAYIVIQILLFTTKHIETQCGFTISYLKNIFVSTLKRQYPNAKEIS